MPVPAHGLRVVDDAVPTEEDAGEHVMVASGLGGRAGVECLVEGPHELEHRATQRHVDAGADAGHEERIVDGPVVHDAAHAAREGVGSFEPLLGLRLQLQWQGQPGRAERTRVVEVPGQRPQPVRVDGGIVVAEDDDFAARLPQGTVTGDVEPRPVLAHVSSAADDAP